MTAIGEGRVCVKLSGRDAGSKCVITKIVSPSFVEIVGARGRRKVNVKHIEPTVERISAGSDEEIFKALGISRKPKAVEAEAEKTEAPAKKEKRVKKAKEGGVEGS